jgi:hypothetical protein
MVPSLHRTSLQLSAVDVKISGIMGKKYRTGRKKI